MSEKIEVILLDLGNTAIKSAEVIEGEIQNRSTWNSIEEARLHYPNIPVIISSVRNNFKDLSHIFSGPTDIILNHKTKLPISLDYETPETLGPDRIALGAGAHYLFPNENNLVIDLGTCTTIDIIDKNGVFRGGIISPGLKMRMKAMSTFTSGLPDISSDWETINEGKYGKSTKQSLRSGAFNGLLNELNATIETIKADFASINIILTGGDTKFFESRLKAHIFAGSKIVEIGLYRIWKYQ